MSALLTLYFWWILGFERVVLLMRPQNTKINSLAFTCKMLYTAGGPVGRKIVLSALLTRTQIHFTCAKHKYRRTALNIP